MMDNLHSEGFESTIVAEREAPQDELDAFLDSEDSSRRFRTKQVLECFGRERRGPVVNELINSWLRDNKIEIFPAIADADYYGEVELQRQPTGKNAPGISNAPISSAPIPTPVAGVNGWVLSSLKDDAEELDFLLYGASVEDAVTMMKQGNRTKLPLFFSKDDKSSLIGTVTLAQLTFEQTGANSKLVEKATTQVPVVSTNEKLFDWIPTIMSHGFIYGKNQEDEIVQIYTTFDVATHLNAIAAMFLRANEIEELLRTVLSKVPENRLNTARSRTRSLTAIPLDAENEKFFTRDDISSNNTTEVEQRAVDSLMFGDYMKCIGDPDIWDEYFAGTGIAGINKEACLRSLNDARIARNTVMHFNRSDSLENLIPSFEVLAVWLRKVAGQ